MSKYDDMNNKFKEKFTHIKSREETIKSNLDKLEENLIKIFNAEENNITVSKPDFVDDKYKAKITIRFGFKSYPQRSEPRQHSDKAEYLIEGEYLKTTNILFEGKIFEFNEDDICKLSDILYQKTIEKYTI